MKPQPQDYQTFFDMIRPRSEAPLWMLWVFIGFLMLIAILVYGSARVQRRREAKYLRKAFDNLADERGLDRTETHHLWHLAVIGKCEYPLLLFSSRGAFDRCLDHVPPAEDTADQLALLRHKLGFDTRPLGHHLTHSRDMATGQRMWVGFKRNDRTRFCRCVLVENTAEGLLVTPIVRDDEEALKAVHPEETVYVRFWRRGDSEYQFRSRLLPDTDPNRATLLLAHTKPLNRVQHRDFFRQPVHILVAAHTLTDTEAINQTPEMVGNRADPVSTEGWITDLSAGGAALNTPKSLSRGSHLWLEPRGKSPFSLHGVACKVLEVSRQSAQGYWHRLEFQNLNDVRQDALARQIHHAQTPSHTRSQ